MITALNQGRAYNPIDDIDDDYPLPYHRLSEPPKSKEWLIEYEAENPYNKDDNREIFGHCRICQSDIVRRPRRYDVQFGQELCGKCVSHVYYDLLLERLPVIDEGGLLIPSNFQKDNDTAVFGSTPPRVLCDEMVNVVASVHPLQTAKQVYNVKKKQSGNHVIYNIYDNPILKGHKLTEEENSHRLAAAKRTKEINQARKSINERVYRRSDNVLRAKKSAQEVILSNYVENRTWFPCFTINDNNYYDWQGNEMTIDRLKAHWEKFVTEYNRIRLSRGQDKIKYIAWVERGSNYTKRLHMHAILFNCAEPNKQELESIWKWGYVLGKGEGTGDKSTWQTWRVTKVQNSEELHEYLGKYIGKGCESDAYEGHIYLPSKGLRRMDETYAMFQDAGVARQKLLSHIDRKHILKDVRFSNKWLGDVQCVELNISRDYTEYHKEKERRRVWWHTIGKHLPRNKYKNQIQEWLKRCNTESFSPDIELHVDSPPVMVNLPVVSAPDYIIDNIGIG